jgi:hypothetical protein
VTFVIAIFRFLEDGAWHSLKHIASKTSVPIEDLSDYCATLSKHEVVEYDADSGRVRIGPELIKMMTALNAHDRLTGKWRRMGAGTVIVPPQKGFQIQGISMQNMTEQDLKIEFTFKVKPIEIVISTV